MQSRVIRRAKHLWATLAALSVVVLVQSRLAGAVLCYNNLQTIAPDIEHDKIFVNTLVDPKHNPTGEGRVENCDDYNTQVSVETKPGQTKEEQEKAFAAATEEAKAKRIDTCSIFCRSYEMLTSGKKVVQCYRRCLPMLVCKQDMVVEQLYCNKNEQLAVGNSRLLGCAMKCCQTDACNLNIMLAPDIYQNNCTNHLADNYYTCQGGSEETKGLACRGIGDMTLKASDSEKCKGNGATCGPTPCFSMTGEFKQYRRNKGLNYGFEYREDGFIVAGLDD